MIEDQARSIPLREITDDDLRRELSVSDWWAWTREVQGDLRGTAEGRQYMRFRKGPMKRLKEEVVPTLRFAQRYFPDNDMLASFPATDEHGSPDALVRIAGSSNKLPIQVTCDWTYEDEQHLRTVHRGGFAFRVYELTKVTTEVSTLIADRLTAKASHGGYDPGTWLLVHINDERWPPEGLPQVLSQVKAVAAKSPFAATFLVGSSDEKCICALLNGTPTVPWSD